MKIERFKSLVKRSKYIVSSYENLWMLSCYIKTKLYAKKSRRILTNCDKEKIKKYKGIHKGKRCFIVGTGPSLEICI